MMKIFPTASIKQLDAFTIENEPVSSFDLMERAAQAIAGALMKKWDDRETPFVFFAGPGNNGGDALAVARLMAEAGYTQLSAYLFNIKESLSPDCQANFELLTMMPQVSLQIVTTQFTPPALTDEHIVVDGLFGSGLNKPLQGGFAAVVRFINASPATVVSIDIPSGLMGEENGAHPVNNIIKADYTLSLQLPKLAFFFAENQTYVGKWQLLDIGLSQDGIEQTSTPYLLQEEEDYEDMLKPRARFAHKGTFGHALLIAGQQGMAGASILAAKACLRSGAGLLTVHVPFCNNFIVQTSVPEAMTHIDYSENAFTIPIDPEPYQAVAVGPGIGQQRETEEALLEQIENAQGPMVLDADALNILANHRQYIGRLPHGSILTPHPKECDRLVGGSKNSFDRLSKARQLAIDTHVYIVLKGAYTFIISPQGTCWINTTGNPGMATAGSGDVLTGILLSLLTQGYEPEVAARLGVYAHGLAGDIAAKKKGQIGMTAGDIVEWLPLVWATMYGK